MRFEILLLALCLLAYPVAAEYPSLTGYVTDFAGILSPGEEDSLATMIGSIERNTTVEIAVITVQNTHGEDKVLYAVHTGEQNGVGKSATDNGIVIMWSLDNVGGGAIAAGRGSIITDAVASKIGRDSRQYFDRGEYYNGFVYIISELDRILEPQIVVTPQESPPGPNIPLIVLAGGSILIFLLIVESAIVGVDHKHISSRCMRGCSRCSTSRSGHSGDNDGGDDDADADALMAAAVLASTVTSGRYHHYDDGDSSSSHDDSNLDNALEG